MSVSLSVALMLGVSSLLGTSNSFEKANQVVQKSLKNYTASGYYSLSYTNSEQRFYHSSYPFQTYFKQHYGQVAIGDGSIYILDSIELQNKTVAETTLFSLNKYGCKVGDKDCVDSAYYIDHEDFLFKSLIYTPLFALKYYQTIHPRQFLDILETKKEFIVRFNHKNYKHFISIYINKKTNLVTKIEDLTDRNPVGDHLRTLVYSNYDTKGKVHYATEVTLTEMDSTMNKVRLKYNNTLNKSPVEMEEAALVEEPIGEFKAVYTKYNDMIHFIDFVNYNDRSILVEFDTFVFVINAPLYASNGIEIKQQVKKHINKPIKYLSFGHHHPDYIGGIRAFSTIQTNIICHSSVKSYIDYVITNARTINPYFFGFDPKEKGYLLTCFDSIYTVSDTHHEMQMLFMGMESRHTIDYTVFYFPQYKLLIEDDLVFFNNSPNVKPNKQGYREKGLFDFIVSEGLQVDTIIQNYPVHNENYTTIFSFKELKDRDEE